MSKPDPNKQLEPIIELFRAEVGKVDESDSKGKLTKLFCERILECADTVILLKEKGRSGDAPVVARSAFEAAITLAYILNKPEELVTRFIAYAEYERYLMWKTLNEAGVEGPEEGIEGLKERADAIATRFGFQPRQAGKWAEVGIRGMCKELGREHEYTIYSSLSGPVHGSLHHLIKEDPAGKEERDIQMAMAATLMAIMRAVGSLDDSTGVDLKPYLRAVGKSPSGEDPKFDE